MVSFKCGSKRNVIFAPLRNLGKWKFLCHARALERRGLGRLVPTLIVSFKNTLKYDFGEKCVWLGWILVSKTRENEY